MMDESPYSRESRYFGSVNAWLYFHEDNDPNDYDQNLLQSSLKSGNFAKPVTTPQSVNYHLKVSKDFTVRLTKDLCDGLGVNPGDCVVACRVDSKKIVVEASAPNVLLSHERLYTCDKYNNVKMNIKFFFPNARPGDEVEFWFHNAYTLVGAI